MLEAQGHRVTREVPAKHSVRALYTFDVNDESCMGLAMKSAVAALVKL